MAAFDSSYRKLKLKLAFRELFRDPIFYITLAIICTVPWWQAGWTYLFLKSFLYVPSGTVAWLAILLLGISFVSSEVFLFWSVVHKRKSAYEGVMQRPKVWPAWGGIVAIKLLIGPSIALMLWSGMVDEVVKGKSVAFRREDQLKAMLRKIERDGIFTWMIKLEKKP